MCAYSPRSHSASWARGRCPLPIRHCHRRQHPGGRRLRLRGSDVIAEERRVVGGEVRPVLARHRHRRQRLGDDGFVSGAPMSSLKSSTWSEARSRREKLSDARRLSTAIDGARSKRPRRSSLGAHSKRPRRSSLGMRSKEAGGGIRWTPRRW
ncbi:hypothetical protein PVAP13_9KG089400 [Panicum virgatum]|uniref:Uncharacterized protein n=1 Tax=Panicum virgatum TaxID=38727 RepID=A0A8T0NYS5_PANVG|nr:hypothetical protein PVAP13_9KG089400 [Panicum virgatum]